MEYEWKLLADGARADPPHELVTVLYDVYLMAFSQVDSWSAQALRRRLVHSSAALVLQDSGGRIAGFGLYVVPQAELFGKRLCWESSVCIAHQARGIGLSNDALRLIGEWNGTRVPSAAIGWVGGRTQSPIVMRRYGKLGHMFPFDEPFLSPRGRALTSFLQAHVPELANVVWDPASGICRRVYREGRLGDYPEPSTTGKAERMLMEWGFERAHGDAVIVVTEKGWKSGKSMESGHVAGS